MAKKFVSFSDHLAAKAPAKEIDEGGTAAQAKLDANSKIAEIKKKTELGDEEDKLGQQILGLDLKMAQLDLQKTDLQAQKAHLAQAKKIADANKKAGEKREKE